MFVAWMVEALDGECIALNAFTQVDQSCGSMSVHPGKSNFAQRGQANDAE